MDSKVDPIINERKPLGPDYAEASTDQYFFYEVLYQGKQSFILGTMHAGLPKNYFPHELFQYFKTCKTNLFEGDREVFKEQYTEEYKRRQWLPEGQSLRNQLSSKALQHLQQLFPNETTFESLLKAKPFAVAGELGELVKQKLESETQATWDFDNAIDFQLLNQAKTENKQIILLDDLSHKIDEFERNFSLTDLEEKLNRADPIQDDVECGYIARDAYMTGLLENLNSYYEKNCETKSFIQTMNFRTQSWLPKLIAKCHKAGVEYLLKS